MVKLPNSGNQGSKDQSKAEEVPGQHQDRQNKLLNESSYQTVITRKDNHMSGLKQFPSRLIPNDNAHHEMAETLNDSLLELELPSFMTETSRHFLIGSKKV